MGFGLIGRKLGMTQIYDSDGRFTPVTVIRAGPCFVTQIKSVDSDGYSAVQVGFEDAGSRGLNQPEAGHLAASQPLKVLREFRVEEASGINVGDRLSVEQFEAGDKVAVTGISKGKGFAGTVKRHGFRGGPRTHGQSDRLRAPGSIGAGTTPGKVFKGQKMAGQMGNARVTVNGLRVVRADAERDLLLIKGAVPGKNGGLVILRPLGAS
jgi:large subunit ribosomal protein L3